MILVQFKYFTLRHVCNTLDNKIIQKQNILSTKRNAMFLFANFGVKNY